MDPEPPDTPPDVFVTLTDEQGLEADVNRIAEVARRTAASEHASGEISITLVSSERIAALNAEYMGQSGPTDVLSFPIDGPDEHGPPGGGPPRMIGEVVLCPEVAAQQAPSGLDAELDLLTAHGVLHLLGYDHATEAGAVQMRAREHDLTGQSGARAS